MLYSLGKWLPDSPETPECMTECYELLPYNGKYFPLPSTTVLNSTAPTGNPNFIFTAPNAETNYTAPFFGTTTKVYRGASLVDISRAGGYSTTTPSYSSWSMDVYGNILIASNGVDAIQKLANVNSGSFVDLPGTPPRGKAICMFKDQLFIGHTKESGIDYPRRVFRSVQGNIESWSVDSATGCGFYDLPSWGERVVGFSTHGDYLLVFMTNSIWLLTFIGAPLWYSYTKLYDGTGPISPGCIANIGNMTTLVLTPKDVLMVSGTSVTSLGNGIRSFLADWEQLYPYKVTNIVDPDKKLVLWAFPTNNFYGRVDKMLIYNYEEDRFTASVNNPFSCIGAIRTPETGRVFYACYDGATNKLCKMDGTAKASTITTTEVNSEAISMATQIEPRISNFVGTISTTLYSRLSQNSSVNTTVKSMNSQGVCNLRASGKFFKAKFDIIGNHSGFYGYAADYTTRGKR